MARNINSKLPLGHVAFPTCSHFLQPDKKIVMICISGGLGFGYPNYHGKMAFKENGT